MASGLIRTARRIYDNKRLRWLFAAGFILFLSEVGIETFCEHWLATKIWPKFFVRFLGGIGEISILSMFFGIFFDFKEREELIDEAAKKYGMLGGLSEMGIKDFRPDSKEFDHSEDFINSKELTIFIYGSKELFINRINLIEERLKLKKSITFVVNEKRNDGIKKLFELLRAKEYSSDFYENLKIFKQPVDPNYNFVQSDDGLWIKGYFLDQHDLPYGVPAFFVEKDTTMYQRYMSDIEKNRDGWIELDESGLKEFMEGSS